MAEAMANATIEDKKIEYDISWDDPLPHAYSPTKYYLSRIRPGITKVITIFMHGRGDNIDDMVDIFIPILIKRYGGVDGQVKNDGEYDKYAGKECVISVIGIEARDNSWYPESHNAIEDYQIKNNESYQYSSLDKIRKTILDACRQADLQPKNVIFVGFSQGANLGNTYLQLGMEEILKKQGKQEDSQVPLPGHVLALAGSLFKVPPSFPSRGYTSNQHQQDSLMMGRKEGENYAMLKQPSKIVNRLICGTGDRFFSEEEIKEAASTLGHLSQQVASHVNVEISVALEPRAPHVITARMIAAVIEAIDEVLGGDAQKHTTPA